jgi:glycosyltransferase involved in cell wall biosynthesis
MADVNIANVGQTKRLLESELGVEPSRTVVLPVAVDKEEITKFASKHYKKKEQFVVVSRLVAHKRVALAIEAVAKTKAKLVIVGTGPDLQELQALARRKAPGRVTFLHSLPIEKHYKLVCESRALIMASEREGLSLVTVEALALGTPVVITTTSSLPKELRSMCLETSEERMHELLNRMLTSGARYDERAKRMRGRVLAEFSAENAQEVYDGILER